MCQELHGKARELQLFQQYGHDVDYYIEKSLQPPESGGGYTCKKCKGTQGVVQLLQTRSADEGMTAYIVCPECNHRRLFS
jgi:DNA-directed RNA polymerase subunit M/transcription elongation factor TFIIS